MSASHLRNILIIDDEEKLRKLFARIIASEGFEVHEAGDCKTALKKLEQTTIDVVLCDVKLPDGNGLDLISKIKTIQPLTEIILLTAYGNIPDGVNAIKQGAFDYITKGDDNEKIIPYSIELLKKYNYKSVLKILKNKLDRNFPLIPF